MSHRMQYVNFLLSSYPLTGGHPTLKDITTVICVINREEHPVRGARIIKMMWWNVCAVCKCLPVAPNLHSFHTIAFLWVPAIRSFITSYKVLLSIGINIDEIKEWRNISTLAGTFHRPKHCTKYDLTSTAWRLYGCLGLKWHRGWCQFDLF